MAIEGLKVLKPVFMARHESTPEGVAMAIEGLKVLKRPPALLSSEFPKM
jgi:hypothetical protein